MGNLQVNHGSPIRLSLINDVLTMLYKVLNIERGNSPSFSDHGIPRYPARE